MASAMPVLPLVGSTMVVLSGEMRPASSAASIIERPMRSLTLPPGLNDSSLPTIVAPERSERPRSLTSGVPPIRAVMSSAIFTVSAPLVVAVRSRTWARRRPAGVRARRGRSRWCGPARPGRRCRRRARPSRRPRAPPGRTGSCGDGSRPEAPSSASTTSRTVSRSGRRAKVKPPPTPRWPVTRPARRRPAKSCSRYCSGMPRSAARSTSRTGRLVAARAQVELHERHEGVPALGRDLHLTPWGGDLSGTTAETPYSR